MPKRLSLADDLRARARRVADRTGLRALAREAGINEGNLSAFLAGRKSLSLESAGRLAEVLGLRLAERATRRKRQG